MRAIRDGKRDTVTANVTPLISSVTPPNPIYSGVLANS